MSGVENDHLPREERSAAQTTRPEAAPASGPPVQIIGESEPIIRVFRLVEAVADTCATALITGETGTGKELIARALHAGSARRNQPFVAVHCGALADTLLEDELFGHVKGAYTDALESKPGCFERAHQGTLFLDEIGTMPLQHQIRLLRVLQERQVQRVGGTRPIPVDVRVITATNVNLEELVQEGTFRKDLFFRLNVFPIDLPPLRHRMEDLPLLAEHLVDRCAHRLQRPRKTIHPDALEGLLLYDWPGNVRELENILERACILSRERTLITPADLPAELQPGAPAEESAPALEDLEEMEDLQAAVGDGPEGIDLKQVVSNLEKRLILQSLQKTKGDKTKAARLLGLKRTTLLQKLKRQGLFESSG